MSVTFYRRELANAKAQAQTAREQGDRQELDRLASRLFCLRLCAAMEGVSWSAVERKKQARAVGVPTKCATLEAAPE